jgi:hypothetical protein
MNIKGGRPTDGLSFCRLRAPRSEIEAVTAQFDSSSLSSRAPIRKRLCINVWYISELELLPVSAMMMETEPISKMLLLAMTWLIAGVYFCAFICCGNFKSYIHLYSCNEVCCMLNRCVHFIKPIYCSYQKSEQENSHILSEENIDSQGGKEEEEDDDDFLADQLQGHVSSNSTPLQDIFSYSSSPGFKWL